MCTLGTQYSCDCSDARWSTFQFPRSDENPTVAIRIAMPMLASESFFRKISVRIICPVLEKVSIHMHDLLCMAGGVLYDKCPPEIRLCILLGLIPAN